MFEALRGDQNRVWSRGPSISSDWERGYVSLPDGYRRVIIEAKSEGGGVNAALDDVKITTCKPGKIFLFYRIKNAIHKN